MLFYFLTGWHRIISPLAHSNAPTSRDRLCGWADKQERKPIFNYWKDSNNHCQKRSHPDEEAGKILNKKTCSLLTNTAVSVVPSLSVVICLLFFFCFSGESFPETLAWQRGFCDSVTYGKTRERDMERSGVSVARGRRVPFPLGEQGFGKSFAMDRASEKTTLDSQSFILLFYIFSMPLQNAFWLACFFSSFLSSLHTEAARLRISADFVRITGCLWLTLSLSIPVKFSPEATEPWIEVEWDFEAY